MSPYSSLSPSSGSGPESRPSPRGIWQAPHDSSFIVETIERALAGLDQEVHIVGEANKLHAATVGSATLGAATNLEGAGDRASVTPTLPLWASLAPLPPESLGDGTFRRDYGLRYAYVAGAMANGIGSCDIVEQMAAHGMLGFFGSAGLPLPQVEAAIDRLQASVGDGPFGINLIHSPNEPDLEAGLVDLLLRKGVRRVEASAYLDLTLPVVRYRVTGIHRDDAGRVVVPNQVMAKVSRVEVARKFLAPPPQKLLDELVARGEITPAEAELALTVPMAQDLTAEADSGGHTDNRPALALLPTLLSLRDQLQSEHGYDRPLRVGAAGGIATPASAAAAFAMGAAYIVTGSINQACRESGTCDQVRQMLAAAEQADVIMAPAADMFEMGVEVQVLKRGTLFAMRGKKLFELYRSCGSLEEIPAGERAQLEKSVFRASLEEIWQQTAAFFAERDPRQLQRAERDPKHRMALVFRWYLGLASHWANRGEDGRQIDYQIWCGPAMGAFNEWARGSYLEDWQERRVAEVAYHLLHGAALSTRWNQVRTAPIFATGAASLPATAHSVRPLQRSQVERWQQSLQSAPSGGESRTGATLKRARSSH